MSTCQYRYNASEQYQRAKPGMGVETICGARTYPAVDEPEIGAYPRGDGTTEFRATGKMVRRGFDDPYCPAHGGTPEPPPEPVTLPELENAYERYLLLRERFQGAVPATVPPPQEITSGGVTPDVYQAATGQAPDAGKADDEQ